jgi:NO-binding membrane sensor protein with MHYT domain
MNSTYRADLVSFEAIDAALFLVLVLCGLDLIGQLAVHIHLYFMHNLVPRGVESPLLQHVLVGFVITLIVGLTIVVALLRRELRENTV